MVKPSGRLPRFRRATENVRNIRLTPRDERIIELVERYRFLRSSQIVRLVEGAPTEIIRRLQMLFHHGMLTRPRCQLDFFHRGGGTKPIVYGLARQGARLMLRRGSNEDVAPASRRRREGEPVGRLFLEHTLMVAEVLITMEEACGRIHPRARYISPGELISGRKERSGHQWRVLVRRRRVALIPDGVFGVEWEGETGIRERITFFLEADRGTMPIHRRAAHQSSIARKLAAYSALWENGTFEEQFETNRFVVLIVTTGGERARNIAAAVRGLSVGRGLFACHALSEINEAGDAVLRRFVARDRTAEM